eukprot:4864464-Alexandrium_andersonii.AAC.1
MAFDVLGALSLYVEECFGFPALYLRRKLCCAKCWWAVSVMWMSYGMRLCGVVAVESVRSSI